METHALLQFRLRRLRAQVIKQINSSHLESYMGRAQRYRGTLPGSIGLLPTIREEA